ncbi:BhlA/UviB family holin-like peptide [Romboutsia sedimentorum]|uniref:BhlA/UviB family holin-like peptide n=1 Tax=Romboutsia sedimentorum TaxID=1368474 RepID=UPI0024DE89D8|nr:BhlA/UviB family holin-like peptide [Romboutsia sedimentorum]MDK2587549.1 BhlA/UviB family holin-like peptide [Romboutsia sedimentorum]
MENLIAKLLSEYGFVITAFACLLYYVLNENSKRELRYENIINKNQKVIITQAKSFEVVKDMKADIEDLKEVILNK